MIQKYKDTGCRCRPFLPFWWHVCHNNEIIIEYGWWWWCWWLPWDNSFGRCCKAKKLYIQQAAPTFAVETETRIVDELVSLRKSEQGLMQRLEFVLLPLLLFFSYDPSIQRESTNATRTWSCAVSHTERFKNGRKCDKQQEM